MSNDQMKANRFLNIHKGRVRFKSIVSHLRGGGSVMVLTSTKGTIYGPKHFDSFKLGKSGSVYVKRGKALDCIDYTPVRFSKIAA